MYSWRGLSIRNMCPCMRCTFGTGIRKKCRMGKSIGMCCCKGRCLQGIVCSLLGMMCTICNWTSTPRRLPFCLKRSQMYMKTNIESRRDCPKCSLSNWFQKYTTGKGTCNWYKSCLQNTCNQDMQWDTSSGLYKACTQWHSWNNKCQSQRKWCIQMHNDRIDCWESCDRTHLGTGWDIRWSMQRKCSLKGKLCSSSKIWSRSCMVVGIESRRGQFHSIHSPNKLPSHRYTCSDTDRIRRCKLCSRCCWSIWCTKMGNFRIYLTRCSGMCRSDIICTFFPLCSSIRLCNSNIHIDWDMFCRETCISCMLMLLARCKMSKVAPKLNSFCNMRYCEGRKSTGRMCIWLQFRHSTCKVSGMIRIETRLQNWQQLCSQTFQPGSLQYIDFGKKCTQ